MPLVSSIRPFYSLQQIQSVNTHIYLLYVDINNNNRKNENRNFSFLSLATLMKLNHTNNKK